VHYLNKTFFHCRGCKRDTFGKKLLVMNYLGSHVHHLKYSESVLTEPFDDDDNLDVMEIDDDVLDSPLLRDCDNFDDFDGDDALLPLAGGPGIEISNLSLF
jgi:hypothetical protein